MNLFCGIDIGGTGVKTLLMDSERKVLSSDFFFTQSVSGPDVFLKSLRESIRKQMDSVADGVLLAAGIGCTGPVDINSGYILNPYTLSGLEGLCITRAVSDGLGVPVYLENDANTAHLGEIAALGEADPGNTVLVILGTGIGCSVRVGYTLFRVPGGIHPEIGHTSCGVPSDVPCYCGKNNCMENILSGTAINRDAKRFFNTTPEAVLDICDTDKKRQFRENLVCGLFNMAATMAGIFDSKLVILAGGMHDFYEKYLLKAAQERLDLLNPVFGMTKLITAKLGSDSGRLGAAILAQERLGEVHE
ncbi:MAG: ROK family protein [Flexilinea sp.]